MTDLTPASWIESEDFRDVVKPDQQADFLKTITEAHSEGYAISRVIVMNGVPVIYERRELPKDD